MPEIPSKRHMYDMVKEDTIVFEIVAGGGGRGIIAPPPRIAVWNIPDRIRLNNNILVCMLLNNS